MFGKSFTFLFALVIITTAQLVHAKDSTNNNQNDFLKSLEYPELVVTPLASQRLINEAKNESSRRWTALSAIQASGLMTLLAGSQSSGDYNPNLTDTQEISDNKDRVDNAAKVAQAIGGAWFIGATALSAMYTPYKDGYREIKKISSKTKQQKLVRERLAEEKINSAGSLARKLKYLSAVSNLLANGLIIAEAQEDSQITAGIAALTAFAPFIFESHWEKVSEIHGEYKKKIYGPVTGIAPTKNGFVPTLGLAVSF